ncbi:hypothetical protein SISNIDRAFT_481329 [Sistotremastrum niveocremeum HHB9708]|uniref:Malate dehydrogenase n=1 Tax=Sistotremastrum niveocremeum HHB9708 TaxID=1314777 RepID=A0A165A890_9AGAM|nr:hypothetical protein SISNIDRAFT_481329 [Sistotremastrum niveocremeum HHB9708]
MFSLVVLFSLFSFAIAYPLQSRSLQLSGCPVSTIKPSFPSNQTTLSVPAGQKPQYIAIGVGVQNYTCGSTGTYTSIGAVADLFDFSCLAKETSILNTVPSILYGVEVGSPPAIKFLDSTPLHIGKHFFAVNPTTGSGISPAFHITTSHEDALFVGNKIGDIKAPTDSTHNVDWLQLSTIEGTLAKTVYRIQTKQGQPPASCKPGAAISVPYAAQYWFLS